MALAYVFVPLDFKPRYKAMAADQEREGEAQAWCHALLADMADEAR